MGGNFTTIVRSMCGGLWHGTLTIVGFDAPRSPDHSRELRSGCAAAKRFAAAHRLPSDQHACGELHVSYRIVSVDKSAVLWPVRVSEFGAGGERSCYRMLFDVYEHGEALFVTNFYTRLRIETAAHVRQVSQATSSHERRRPLHGNKNKNFRRAPGEPGHERSQAPHVRQVSQATSARQPPT